MKTVTKLTCNDEKVLNRLLRNKKKEKYTLLYYSEWCRRSEQVLSYIDEWKETEGDEDMYLISSWELPHAFAAFSIMSAPAIVKVNKGRISVMVEFPKVYSYFKPKVKSPARSKG